MPLNRSSLYCGMGKRTYREIRKAILLVLNDGETRSYGYLEKKVHTNWQTIRDHCGELELFGAISIDGKSVMITVNGRSIFNKM